MSPGLFLAFFFGVMLGLLFGGLMGGAARQEAEREAAYWRARAAGYQSELQRMRLRETLRMG